VDEGPRQIVVGAPAYVQVHNEMGKRFRLTEAIVLLDASEVAHVKAVKDGELERDFRAFEGAVPPGEHAVTVTLIFQGRNSGVFNYVKDYHFRAETTGAFTVSAGDHRPATLEVVAREHKGASVPFEKKPQLEIMALPGSSATPVLQPSEPTLGH